MHVLGVLLPQSSLARVTPQHNGTLPLVWPSSSQRISAVGLKSLQRKAASKDIILNAQKQQHSLQNDDAHYRYLFNMAITTAVILLELIVLIVGY